MLHTLIKRWKVVFMHFFQLKNMLVFGAVTFLNFKDSFLNKPTNL